MIARPISEEATRSILMLESPLSERSLKLKRNTATASARTIMNTGRHPTRMPSVPPIRNALIPRQGTC